MTTSDADAPAFTPSSPGSPSGLRVSPWITTPATASAAPTSSPSSVRGMRDATTVEVYEPSGCRQADHTSPSGIGFDADGDAQADHQHEQQGTAATRPTREPERARAPHAGGVRGSGDGGGHRQKATERPWPRPP